MPINAILIFLGLGLASLLPVLGVLRAQRLRGRREAALDLHRAQLSEIARERDAGRLPEAEFAAAKLEIERRLLAAAGTEDPQSRAGGLGVLAGLALLVPLGAAALYASQGSPGLIGQVPPPQAAAPTAADDAQAAAAEARMVQQLRDVLAQMPDSNPRALEGYLLLGRVELGSRNLPQAAEAYRHALRIKFDPAIAAITGELLNEIAGRKTPEALALWQQAIAAAPPEAPWRVMVQKRLDEARKEGLIPARPANGANP